MFSDSEVEIRLFGGRYSSHIKMRWEWREAVARGIPGDVGSEGSAWRVGNRVFDEQSNSAARTRLRSVIPEEVVTSERYLGVRDVLREQVQDPY